MTFPDLIAALRAATEDAAIAIHNDHLHRHAAFSTPWEECNDGWQNQCRNKARAAIEGAIAALLARQAGDAP